MRYADDNLMRTFRCPAVERPRPPARDCALELKDPPKLPDPAVAYSQWREFAVGGAPTWNNGMFLPTNSGFTYFAVTNYSPNVSAANVEVVIEAGPWGIGMPREPIHTARAFLPPGGEPLWLNPTLNLGEDPFPLTLHAEVRAVRDLRMVNNVGQFAAHNIYVTMGATALVRIPVCNDGDATRTFALYAYADDGADSSVGFVLGSDQLELGPGETGEGFLTVWVGSDTPKGAHPVTVSAIADGELVGGVTMRVILGSVT